MPKLTLRSHHLVRGLLAVTLVAGLAACSDDNDDNVAADGGSTTSASTASGPAFGTDGCTAADLSSTTDLKTKPVIEIPECQPPAGLETADIVEGKGDAVAAGASVEVQYVGVSWSTGEEFDASWDRGSSFTFGLGQGQVIPGWDQGVAGMKPGGRRILVIPSDLGYGDAGSPPAIKGGETLVFVVDLIPPPEPVPCDLAKIEVSAQTQTKPTVSKPDCNTTDALETSDVVVGTGDEATSGQKVTVHYVGISVATGEQFDASWDRGETFSFTLGAGEVIPGWDQGVAGMKVGGRRTLLIPADLAYGAQGSPPAIAANATLLFVVDLVKVEKGS